MSAFPAKKVLRFCMVAFPFINDITDEIKPLIFGKSPFLVPLLFPGLDTVQLLFLALMPFRFNIAHIIWIEYSYTWSAKDLPQALSRGFLDVHQWILWEKNKILLVNKNNTCSLIMCSRETVHFSKLLIVMCSTINKLKKKIIMSQ